MDEMRNNLQAIKNTLETLVIPATCDNMEKLLACQQLLSAMIEDMKEAPDGNTDAE